MGFPGTERDRTGCTGNRIGDSIHKASVQNDGKSSVAVRFNRLLDFGKRNDMEPQEPLTGSKFTGELLHFVTACFADEWRE